MNNLCPLPWLSFFVNTDGRRKLCCMGRTDGSFDLFEEIEFVKDIKQDMLENKRPSECKLCWEIEDTGYKSYRQTCNHLFEKISIDEIKKSGNKKIPPILFDIRVSKICNLACKMCTSLNSSKWDVLSRKSGVESFETQTPNYKWFQDKNNQEGLVKLITESVEYHDLAIIRITGGEPLIDLYHVDFLTKFPQSIKDKIKLEYFTNATIPLNNNFIRMIESVGSSDINISIEAASDVNNYIRWPSKYKDIKKNIYDFKNKGYNISFSTTIQSYNILHLSEVAKEANKLGIDITYQFVQYPEILNIFNLPKEILLEGIKRIESSINDVSQQGAEELKSIISVFKRQSDKNIKNDVCSKILHYSNSLDQHTGIYLKDSIPDLYKLLEVCNAS